MGVFYLLNINKLYMKDFHYFGLFLDEETKNMLLQKLENNHVEYSHIIAMADELFLDHCTLLHNSQKDNIQVLTFCQCCEGTEFTIKINGIGVSNKAMAFKVELSGISCANRLPHITIATFNGGKPVDSNNIKEWKDIEPIIIKTTLKKV